MLAALIMALIAGPQRALAEDTAPSLIVAVDDTPEPLPGVGGMPRLGYRGGAGYAGGIGAAAVAASVAVDYGLQEEAAWTIDPLHWRCLRLRAAPGVDAAALLTRLAHDPRVRLAQASQVFTTYGEAAASVSLSGAYNDPYVTLQRGFSAIDAAGAQRRSRGEGVRIALIDSGVDATHPDLTSHLAETRDYASPAHPPPAQGERHGTQMAGVLVAGANNGIGIVGVAPMARLLAFRACWDVPAGGSACDSYTLAQALGAAIAADADVINLSLGGPEDPLLQRLLAVAMAHGAIVVAALPPSGRAAGFPSGMQGVLVVGSSDDTPVAPGGLSAPGRDILSSVPGGGYDYASGSSFAAAQVSGAVALLRAKSPRLRADTARDWLSRGPIGGAARSIDACAALRHVVARAECATVAPP